jgi:hypothetical protein
METDRPAFLTVDPTSISDFRHHAPDLAQSAEDLLLLEWQLVSLVAHMNDKFGATVNACIQQLHRYHIESCLLSMRNQSNIAMALTRMACELSRDILRMSEDHAAEKLWRDARHAGSNDTSYKKIFKFRRTQASEEQLYNLYKLTSDYGVHGHILFTEESESYRQVKNSS